MQAGVEVYSPDHIEPLVIKEKLRMAVQGYLTIKKQVDWRDIWMAQIIQAQADSKQVKRQSKLWKQLRQTEAARRKATAFRKALRINQHHAGLQQITAPTADGEPTRITHTTKVELEEACLNEARRRFTQAANTPMLQEPLKFLLGNTTLTAEAFQQVLEGTFQCPEECNLYTKKYWSS